MTVKISMHSCNISISREWLQEYIIPRTIHTYTRTYSVQDAHCTEHSKRYHCKQRCTSIHSILHSHSYHAATATSTSGTCKTFYHKHATFHIHSTSQASRISPPHRYFAVSPHIKYAHTPFKEDSSLSESHTQTPIHQSTEVNITPQRAHTLLHTLHHRGLLAATTHPLHTIEQHLNQHTPSQPRTIYLGVDPTGPSLHIGHLLVLQVLRYFYLYGYRCIIVIGGATGMIGDPSGRSTERKLLTAEEVSYNIESIKTSIQRILHQTHDTITEASSTERYPIQIVNNIDWYNSMNLITFLRDVGKDFKINSMLQRDSVKQRIDASRMDARNESMSFTEFTYQILQAYDYAYLYHTYNCTIQIGGSDQWGNIVAGMEYINKHPEKLLHNQMNKKHEGNTNDGNQPLINGSNVGVNASNSAHQSLLQHPQHLHEHQHEEARAFGMTVPLLTTSTGQKFGKSAGNTCIWLDSTYTSPFQFYQYWLSVGDADVARYMKLFTFMSDDEIALYNKTSDNKDGLHRLAYEVTLVVRGKDETLRAVQATNALFPSAENSDKKYDFSHIHRNDIISAFAGVPQLHLSHDDFLNHNIVSLAVKCQACTSKGEARRLINAGGIYMNNQRVHDSNYKLTMDDAMNGVCILRVGKSRQHLILLSS